MLANRRITRNAAVNFVGWQLSRRGWNVQYRVLNARGVVELHIEDGNNNKSFSIQPRGLSSVRTDIGLGKANVGSLPSDWWVITVGIHTDQPTCYVLSRNEVVGQAKRDSNGQQWLTWKDFAREEYCEAWHRIGNGSD
jgi:hypothetical protein